LIILAWTYWAIHFEQRGWDFTQFYIAAHLPAEALYDEEAAARFADENLAPIGITYHSPLVRPAIFTIFYRPLALFAYWPAYWLWAAASLAGYLAALTVIRTHFRTSPFFLPISLSFFPAMWGVVTGQDAGLYFLCMTGAVILLEKRRDQWAGLALALCLYKFNMAILIPPLLLMNRRYRALATFLAGACLLVLGSLAMSNLTAYVRQLTRIRELSMNFSPGGIRGVLESLGLAWLYLPVALLMVLALFWYARHVTLLHACLTAILVTILVSPHSTWYDGTLLILPAARIWSLAGMKLRMLTGIVLACPLIWIFDNGISGRLIDFILLAILVYLPLRSEGSQLR
jgi:hypothetical protein